MTINIPETIPVGLSSAGQGSLFVAPTVSDPLAPSVAEFADPTGWTLHCDTAAWNVTLDHPKVQKNRYCLDRAQEKFGRKQYTSDPLEVVYNPQEPDDPEYQGYLKMVEGLTVWVADRRGFRSRQPLAVGDVSRLLQITIGGRNPMPITDEDGEEHRSQIFLSIQDVYDDVVFVA